MTATYWEIGRRIVEFEQGGEGRATYGEALIRRLGTDLSQRFGGGFGWRNLAQMRAFYLGWSTEQILQTLSAKSPSSPMSRRRLQFLPDDRVPGHLRETLPNRVPSRRLSPALVRLRTHALSEDGGRSRLL